MNTGSIVLLTIAGFFLICYAIIVILFMNAAKKIKTEQERLEKEFEAFYGQKPAKDKILKDLQIKSCVKPTLKSQALEFKSVCDRETSLLHQIKVDPKSLPYIVASDYVQRNRADVEAQKKFFYQTLKVAINLGFVPENTTFKKCLNYK